jgi:POT family proton-dependent oligopeptide transporter
VDGQRKIEPDTVVKFGFGFLFLAGGFYVFYYTNFSPTPKGLHRLAYLPLDGL